MVLWLASQPLVLASRSDVRGKILAAAGLRFETRPSADATSGAGIAGAAADCSCMPYVWDYER